MNVLAQQTGMSRSDFLARYVRGNEPVVPMPACDIEPHAANPLWSTYRFPAGTKFSDAELCDLAFTGGAVWSDNVWRIRQEMGKSEPLTASIGHDCTSFALPKELTPHAPWGPSIAEYIDQHDKQTFRNGPLANVLWSFALLARDTGRHPTHIHGQYEPGVFAGGLPANDPRWLIAEALCQKPPRYFPTICKGKDGYNRLRAIDMPTTIAYNDYIRDWESRGVAQAIKASGLPADVTWSKEYSQRVSGKVPVQSPWPTHFAPGQAVPDGRTSHLYWVADSPEWRDTFAQLFRRVPSPIVVHLNLFADDATPPVPLDWILAQIQTFRKKVSNVILFYPPRPGSHPAVEQQYQTVIKALVPRTN